MALAATDFQLLANAGFPPAKFKPGEVIFSEGDKGDKMYVIRSGEVEVERDGKIVETLSGGGIFGEMALIDGSPRAATARGPRRLARWLPSPRKPSCSWCTKRRSSPSP
jgi:CRP-like cAMP-binding protein